MYKSESIFKTRIRDPKAIYLSPMKGRDDAEALQDAINLVNDKLGEGIVFVEEGEYILNRTIYIPTGIRVIGWGKKRPVFRLVDNCEALATPAAGDKGEATYLLWFVGRKPEAGRPIFDANAGTFYSALWNVNIDMGHGNTNAVAMRAHYAQHSFISRVEIIINDAKAGIFDTGNAMDHVCFKGGEYGIYTT
ncbi:MAG: gluconolaconase, partial [Clostridia bacterium]|nr:gluconolaconase [Clostridia bacterium]